MARKRKLDVESTTMHKVDGMESYDRSTTEIYAPKKASDIKANNESLFNDAYMNEKASSSSEAEIPTAVVVIVGIIVLALIAFGVYYFKTH